MSEQLDLLTWQPPSADILAFPQRRNLARVRRVATVIEKCKSAASRQRAFDRELWTLCQTLKANGLSTGQVNRQLEEFTNAVNAELWRINGRQRPGGAA